MPASAKAPPAFTGNRGPQQRVEAVQHEEGADAHADMDRVCPGQDADADGDAERGAGHERPELSPVQRAAQLPHRVALHDQPECNDQRSRLQRREHVKPDRRDDKAEGEAGETGDQRAGKGGEKKQRQFECRSIHVPAPQKSEQRLNGIAISRGGCDFPAGRLSPAWPRAQDVSDRQVLLTVAASCVQIARCNAERFIASAVETRVHDLPHHMIARQGRATGGGIG
jgi:hypothetical protein